MVSPDAIGIQHPATRSVNEDGLGVGNERGVDLPLPLLLRLLGLSG